MNTIQTLMLVGHVIIAALLIGLVLLQRGKGAEAGAGAGEAEEEASVSQTQVIFI